MKVSRRTAASLLATALFTTMVVMYPFYKLHAGNWDHYLIFLLSRTISEMGSAPWILNWSSYFGLHQTSYPQGVPFLLSSFQQLSGDYSENLVMVFSYMEGIMAVIFAFLLGLTIRKKDYLFAFFIAILFATAPSYVYVAGWTSSARGLFVSLLPMFLILNTMLFDTGRNRKRVVAMNIIALIFMFTIHRMAFFLLATAIPALVLSYILYRQSPSSYISRAIAERGRIGKYALGLAIIGIFAVTIYIFYSQRVFAIRLEEAFTTSRVISGDSALVRILNMAFTFVASAGILVVFGFLSVFDMVRDRKFDSKSIYILLALLFLMAIILYPSYFRPYASIFLSIFIAIFLIIFAYNDSSFKIGRIEIGRKVIPLLLVASILFSIGMQVHWNDPSAVSKQWMDYDQEDMVLATEIAPGDRIFISSGDVMRFTALYSDEYTLPPGGYTYDYYFYMFTNSPDILGPDDVSLSFSPKVYWSGKMYLYNEEIHTDENLSKIYNLTYYDLFEVRAGPGALSHFSQKSVANESYMVYQQGDYQLYLVDRSNEDIQRTKLYFYRPQ